MFKNAAAVETLARTTVVAFDKTGTLTTGQPTLVDLISVAPFDDQQMLRLAAAVERLSQHPLAAAVVRGAEARSLAVPEGQNFESVTGGGVRGTVEQQIVRVGSTRFLTAEGVADAGTLDAQANELREQGRTVFAVAVNQSLAGLVAVADPIKESTPAAIRQLHSLGLKLLMLTGDNERTARAVASQLHIDDIAAGVSPGDKQDRILALQQSGAVVTMTGDGINDAPALAAADVGVAMGTGTGVAIESGERHTAAGRSGRPGSGDCFEPGGAA